MQVLWLRQKYSALDSLHYIDYLWACEDGLWYRHPEFKIAGFLFKDLKYQRESGVYIMITNTTSRHMSKYIPKNDKDYFSSKYLRIESITEMSTHQGVEFF